jgi:hypothetical protein
MFPSVAIVKHVQMDNDNNRFYVAAMEPPFKVGEAIRVVCFRKGELPD